MKVCLPLSLTIDCALFASSGRTKFADRVLLTTRSPASMATGSSVAQYFPSRYSSTKTGTFAPTFTLRTKSLRTTLPANTDAAFRSSSDNPDSSHRNGDINRQRGHKFGSRGGIEQVDSHCLLRNLLGQHDGHGIGFDPFVVSFRNLQ